MKTFIFRLIPVSLRWWFISKFCKSIETPQMEIKIADELERQFFDGSFGTLKERLNVSGYQRIDSIGTLRLMQNAMDEPSVSPRKAEIDDNRFKNKYTCCNCSAAYPQFADPCPYAWDEYNTNGDCLAIK